MNNLMLQTVSIFQTKNKRGFYRIPLSQTNKKKMFKQRQFSYEGIGGRIWKLTAFSANTNKTFMKEVAGSCIAIHHPLPKECFTTLHNKEKILDEDEESMKIRKM